MTTRRAKSGSGKQLNILWRLGAKQAFYRATGDFYMMLQAFPGALCDANGYIVFDKQSDLLQTRGLDVYENCSRINVPSGISRLAGYKSVPDQLRVVICP
jgi:hypothetical protein